MMQGVSHIKHSSAHTHHMTKEIVEDKIITPLAAETIKKTESKSNFKKLEGLIALKPKLIETDELNNLDEEPEKPTPIDDNPKEKTEETKKKKGILSTLRVLANKVVEAVEHSQTITLLLSKEANAVLTAERKIHSSDHHFMQSAAKATKAFTFTGFLDVVFLATGAVETVNLIKSIKNGKKNIEKLQEQKDTSLLKIKVHNKVLKKLQKMIDQAKNEEERMELLGFKIEITEKKNAEAVKLWETREKIKKAEKKQTENKRKVPLFSANVISTGMKVVDTISDFLKFLATKGAVARAATKTVSLAASMVLMPITGVISLGISIYLTDKAIKEIKKTNKELKEIEFKIKALQEVLEVNINRASENVGNTRLLSVTAYAELINLEAQQDLLIERKRLLTLDIASQATLMGASVSMIGTSFSTPASPYLLGGTIITFLTSIGIGTYQYFSARSFQKQMGEKYKNVKMHPNTIMQLGASWANRMMIDRSAFKRLEVLLALNADEKELLKEHPVEFFKRHFAPLQQKLEEEERRPAVHTTILK